MSTHFETRLQLNSLNSRLQEVKIFLRMQMNKESGWSSVSPLFQILSQKRTFLNKINCFFCLENMSLLKHEKNMRKNSQTSWIFHSFENAFSIFLEFWCFNWTVSSTRSKESIYLVAPKTNFTVNATQSEIFFHVKTFKKALFRKNRDLFSLRIHLCRVDKSHCWQAFKSQRIG